MMELTSEQVAWIGQDIRKKGMTMNGLADSLIDHICCSIENDPGSDFHEAYTRTLTAFGSAGLKKIQEETILLLTLKKEVTMKKTMYVLGYTAAFLITTGLLFKLQQWPGAAVMLTIGIVLFNVGFLPMFFYDKYKRAIS
jgi:hypothetical protein